MSRLPIDHLSSTIDKLLERHLTLIGENSRLCREISLLKIENMKLQEKHQLAICGIKSIIARFRSNSNQEHQTIHADSIDSHANLFLEKINE